MTNKLIGYFNYTNPFIKGMNVKVTHYGLKTFGALGTVVKIINGRVEVKMTSGAIFTYNPLSLSLDSTKPHISKKRGYWSVSPLPKPYRKYGKLWNDAHTRANQLNQPQGINNATIQR